MPVVRESTDDTCISARKYVKIVCASIKTSSDGTGTPFRSVMIRSDAVGTEPGWSLIINDVVDVIPEIIGFSDVKAQEVCSSIAKRENRSTRMSHAGAEQSFQRHLVRMGRAN